MRRMRPKNLPLRNSQIVTLYVDQGMPLTDLAPYLGCSLQRVREILRAYDVKLRTRSEATRLGHHQATLRLQAAEQARRQRAGLPPL